VIGVIITGVISWATGFTMAKTYYRAETVSAEYQLKVQEEAIKQQVVLKERAQEICFKANICCKCGGVLSLRGNVLKQCNSCKYTP